MDWWIDGIRGHFVDVADRGLQYGDGVFETCAIRQGVVRFADHHFDRLFGACARLKIPPPDRAALAGHMSSTAAAVGHGVLKLIVTRGSGPRGYRPPEAPVPTVICGAGPAPAHAAEPIEIRWCETSSSRNRATAGMKTLNRIEQVLARSEWNDESIAEGLMCRDDGVVTGGTSSNLFLCRDGALLTPSVDLAGVAGIMRRVILEAGHKMGITIHETDLRRGDVDHATEVFVSNALTGIRPVVRLSGRRWPVGPLTTELCARLVAAGVDECARF